MLSNLDFFRVVYDARIEVEFDEETHKVYVNANGKTGNVQVESFSGRTIVFLVRELQPFTRAVLPFVAYTEEYVVFLILFLSSNCVLSVL